MNNKAKRPPRPKKRAPAGSADIAYGRSVLAAEIRALNDLVPLLDHRFAAAVALALATKGRIVVTGVGKSGLVGQKVSATLASTGTASHFLHSGEAVHGDLGRVLSDDLVLALSYSGATEEVVRLVPIIKKIGAPLIAVTRSADTPLGAVADIALSIGDVAEACPIGLAPTSSTTAMLALCDAFAMTIAHKKRFNRESFAMFHPGGSLGRMLVTVGEVMRPASEVPCVLPSVTVAEAMRRMNLPGGARSWGAVLVADRKGVLRGIFTQGDFARRVVEDRGILDRAIEEVATRTPKIAHPKELLADAYRRLEQHRLDELPVVDDRGRVAGLLDVQDILEWGVAL